MADGEQIGWYNVSEPTPDGMDPANDVGQDEEMVRRRNQYRAAQEKHDSTSPGNGTGAHVNGAEAAPDAARERRLQALRAREQELAEEIERNKDNFFYPKSLREESLAKTRDMLSDLEAGRSRGVFQHVDDAVVTGVDAFGEGLYDAGAGVVGLGKQAWGLGGEVLTGDFDAAGDRLGRGADAVKDTAVGAYDAVVNKPWFQGTRDSWATGQYGASVGGVAPEVAGVAGVAKAGARKLLRSGKEVLEDPPTPGNNAVRERKPERTDADEREPNTKGEPVVVATGEYVEEWDDFYLEGTFDLTLTRYYGALLDIQGPFGRNRTSIFDTTFSVTSENDLLFRDERGRRVFFERPFNLSPSRNDKYRNLTLRAPWLKQLTLENGPLTHYFSQGKDKIYRLTRIDDRDGNSLSIERDAGDLIVGVAHSDGYVLHFENDEHGLRRSITLEHGGNERLELARYEYDGEGNLLLADCEIAFSIDYRYDERGRLTEWRDRSRRSITRLQYDNRHRVARTSTTGAWNNDTFEYDHDNRISIYRPGGGEAFEKVHYDEDHNVLWEENALGEITRFQYSDGYRVAETDGEGNTRRYKYDPFGNISSITDGEGRITLYRWGTRGELDMVVDNAGNAYTNEHDGRGHLISSKDPEGHVTFFDWDNAGRLVRTVYPDGSEERRAYDAHHRLVQIIAPNGGITRLARDMFGRVSSVTDASGGVTRYTYDRVKGKGLYWATKIELPDGTTRVRGFDVEGQVSSVTDGAGQTTRYEYGPFDRLLSVTDPLGNTLRLDYDVRGKLVSVTNARGFTYQYETDLAGRVVAETDFESRRTVYHLDKAGRIVRRVAADGSERRFSYDRSDRVSVVALHELRRDGSINEVADEIETFGYDERGLISKATNASSELSFERDCAGRVVAENQNHRRLEFKFDSMGRRIERAIGFAAGWSATGKADSGFQGFTPEDIQAGYILNPASPDFPQPSAPDSVTQYAYDPLGLLTELLIGVGQDGDAQDHLTFQRDPLGRELSRRNGRGFSLQQQFDRVGQLVRQAVGGTIDPAKGRTELEPAVLSKFLTHLGMPVSGAVTSRSPIIKGYNRSFTYDKTHLPVSIADDLWGETRFDYDANGQATKVIHGIGAEPEDAGNATAVFSAPPPFTPLGVGEETREIERFSYDATLNIEASDTARAGEPLSRPLTQWLSASGGSVRAARGPAGERILLTHDKCGRVIERRIERQGFRPEITRFRWNALDRLIGCETSAGERWTYSYDPFGRRNEKRMIARNTLAPGEQQLSRTGPDTRFVWDGNAIAEQIPIRSGALDLERRVIWHHEQGSFRPLARESAQGRVHHIVTDHLGTPRECISAEGKVEWAAQQRLWGGLRQRWRANPSPVRVAANDATALSIAFDTEPEADQELCAIRFQGQWEDEESGLYYNRFRIYDPLTTAYLSPDPIGLEGGLRPGGYVSRPTSQIDPWGLTPLDAPGYSLYHITQASTGKVVYVGITSQGAGVRQAQHELSGRLGRGYEFSEVERNLSYAQARGYEQADIDFYKTRDTSRIGQEFEPGDPNRQWSYDPNRTDERAEEFERHRKERDASRCKARIGK